MRTQAESQDDRSNFETTIAKSHTMIRGLQSRDEFFIITNYVDRNTAKFHEIQRISQHKLFTPFVWKFRKIQHSALHAFVINKTKKKKKEEEDSRSRSSRDAAI